MGTRPKFRKGQIWKDRVGDEWEILTSSSFHRGYPITARRRSDGYIDHFTSRGYLLQRGLVRSSDLRNRVYSPNDCSLSFLWDFREWAWGSSRPTSKIRIVSIGPVTLVWHK